MYERSSATELHDYFKMVKLDKRRLDQLLCHMHKLSKSQGVVIPVGERRTRADNKVKFVSHNFVYKTMQRCPMYRGVWEWDELDADIQSIESRNIFKHKLLPVTHRVALV